MLVFNNGLPLKEIHDMFYNVYLNDNLILTHCIYCIEINVCLYRFTTYKYLDV